MLLPSFYLYSEFVQILCLILDRSESSLGQLLGVGLCWGGARATVQADWHFPHDLEGSVGICVALASPQPAEMAVGSSPSGVIFLLPPELTFVQSLLFLAAFSCISNFGFLPTPSFNENGLHIFAFLFFLLLLDNS